MKFIIPKSDLLKHKKTLKIAKMGRLAKAASLSITVSEKCLIDGPGFSVKLDCRPLTWGRASIPFQVWDRLMRVLDGISRKDIPVEVIDGKVQFDTMIIDNPEIRVVPSDKLATEIPLNLDPVDVIKLFSLGPEDLKASGIWNAVRFYMRRLRPQVEQAALPLKEYGISPEDLAMILAVKLGIEDTRRFVEILFSEE